MKFSVVLLLTLSAINICNSFNVVSINLLLKKSLEDSLISFIKLPYIHNLKIKNHTKYLILDYLDDPKKKLNEKIDMTNNNNNFNRLIEVKDDNSNSMNILTTKIIDGVEIVEQDQNNSFFNVYDTIKNNKKLHLSSYLAICHLFN